jgi:hypothetical protein
MTANRNSPSQQQVEEWLEGECCLYFLSLIKARLENAYQARSEVFFFGEPQRTQEGKVWLLGEENVLQDIIESFKEKDLSLIEEAQSDEEHIRNSALRRPHPHPAG